MTVADLLSRQTRRELERFDAAFRALPEDRRDWKPAPGARSALHQLQECAMLVGSFPHLLRERKLEMTPEIAARWQAEAESVTDPETLLTSLRQGTEDLIGALGAVPEGELAHPVELPFPGEYSVVDIMGQHAWNLAYHEGQITYIGSLLEASETSESGKG